MHEQLALDFTAPAGIGTLAQRYPALPATVIQRYQQAIPGAPRHRYRLDHAPRDAAHALYVIAKRREGDLPDCVVGLDFELTAAMQDKLGVTEAP